MIARSEENHAIQLPAKGEKTASCNKRTHTVPQQKKGYGRIPLFQHIGKPVEVFYHADISILGCKISPVLPGLYRLPMSQMVISRHEIPSGIQIPGKFIISSHIFHHAMGYLDNSLWSLKCIPVRKPYHCMNQIDSV